MAQDPNVNNTAKAINCPNCESYKEAFAATLEMLVYAADPIRTQDEMDQVRVAIAKLMQELTQSIQDRHTGNTHKTGS